MTTCLTPQERAMLDRDYAQGDVVRKDADEYAIVQRGSARLVAGQYRTEPEQKAFIEEGLALRLPGQPGYRRQRILAILSWIRGLRG